MPFDFATTCALLSLVALVFLPGGALIALVRPRIDDHFVRLGLVAGAGLALQPLTALWARLIGLPMRAITLWALLAACAAVIVWRWRRDSGRDKDLYPDLDNGLDSNLDSDVDSMLVPDLISGRDTRIDHVLEPALDPRPDPDRDATPTPLHVASPTLERAATHAMLGILVVLLAARWAVAADLRVPLWGDSVHHAMIAKLFTLQEGLPRDWLPFEPLAPFTYHFGLHALVAGTAQLSGIAEHRALIVVGQALMVLQALSAYALVAGLTGRRWAGIGAALVAGGLGPMPGQYLNWGRYTQLAGQAILPVAALALTRAGRGGNSRRGAMLAAVLAAVLLAGLALTHYLVTIFLTVFGVAWLVFDDTSDENSKLSRKNGGQFLSATWLRLRAVRLGRLALVAAMAVGIASPWIPQFLAGRLDEHAAALLTTELPDPSVWGAVDPAWVWGQLGDFVGFGLVGAAIAAAAWVVVRRDRAALLGLAWTTFLIGAAYPSLFGVPITGVLKDFAVLIGLYVPLGLLVGPAFADAVERLVGLSTGRSPERLSQSTLTLAVTVFAIALAAALHIAGPTRTDVDPAAVYASPADERAFAWIMENTPSDAVFLVSAAPAYAGTVVAGDDGGWWIPQLAGRKTTLPPITYGLEPSIEPGYREAVNTLNAAWREDLDAPETEEALRAAEVGWAYVGPREGVLTTERLAASPDWKVVYEVDGATIFEAAWVEELGR